MEKNPFASPSGGPQPGKLAEFMRWNDQQFEKALSAMSPEERERVLARKRDVARRMQSEAVVS